MSPHWFLGRSWRTPSFQLLTQVLFKTRLSAVGFLKSAVEPWWLENPLRKIWVSCQNDGKIRTFYKLDVYGSVTNAKILSRFSWTPPQSCQGGWGWLDRVHTPWGTIILMWVGILNEIWVIVNPMHFQWRNRTGQHSVIVTILNPKFFRLIYAQIDLYISLWFVVSKEWWCCVVSYPDLDHPHFIGWTGVR